MAGAGPSGDFEIREEDTRAPNEVGRGGKGTVDVGAEPDLIGNSVDAGSSAAQLPQKNILERKEVLIGETCVHAHAPARTHARTHVQVHKLTTYIHTHS